MNSVFISATGVWTPPTSVTNAQLVGSFNSYVSDYNARYAQQIAAGEREALSPSSAEFIEKASGICSRHLYDPENILNPRIMKACLPRREDSALSLHAQMGLSAAHVALDAAELSPSDIDGVIVSCTNIQRPYPGIGIEIQQALGIEGFAYDMQVACSSATFGLQSAANLIQTGQAKRLLVLSPEITCGQVNYRDRDSHFIFGDAASAVLLEAEHVARRPLYEIRSFRLRTAYSNNIRCNFGFLNRLSESGEIEPYFTQQGRKVFKEVIPWVTAHIQEHLQTHDLESSAISRYWLHQANKNMNVLIAKKLLGQAPTQENAPIILDTFGNTASAGSVIALDAYPDLTPGEHGVLASFGAGYSAGSVLLRRL